MLRESYRRIVVSGWPTDFVNRVFDRRLLIFGCGFAKVDYVLVESHGVFVAHETIALVVYRLMNGAHASVVARLYHQVTTFNLFFVLVSEDMLESVVDALPQLDLVYERIYRVLRLLLLHLAL